ncbi:MAG: radical SAM protein [Planctomycetota bacterium]
MGPAKAWREIKTADILAARSTKEPVDATRPYAFFVEQECGPDGTVESVATIFLTNRECPFRCLMCDLWRHTTDRRVAVGAIPGQIEWALERLPAAQHVKLYNSGNFFDPQAIPPADHAAIARLVSGFRTVIVENHPRLCGDACRSFAQLLPADCQLEIALGLETVHPEALAVLNKRMTTADFASAAARLRSWGIELRTFVLLKPPLLDEREGVEWALQSVRFAWQCGVRVVAVIPTRATSGVLQNQQQQGLFEPPTLASLEEVLERGLAGQQGRLMVDLWDAQQLIACVKCRDERLSRLQRMNKTQKLEGAILCKCKA